MLAPAAPSLICLEKSTGRAVWQDNSPGDALLSAQHSNPTVIEVNGQGQVVIGQADGWLRSFDALTGKPAWEFDMNSKGSRLQKESARSRLGFAMAAPVFHDDRIYVVAGRDRSEANGPGRLCCITTKRRGDISSELLAANYSVAANPNSGLLWEQTESSVGGDPFRQSLSGVAIQDNLVIAPDLGGTVHCFDATTGRRYWAHHTSSTIVGAPLIVGDKVYVSSLLSDTLVFELSKQRNVLARNYGGGMSPVFANNTLYLLEETGRLWAIKRTVRD